MKENGSGGGLLDEVTRSGVLLVGGQAHAALVVATAGCQSGRGQQRSSGVADVDIAQVCGVGHGTAGRGGRSIGGRRS